MPHCPTIPLDGATLSATTQEGATLYWYSIRGRHCVLPPTRGRHVVLILHQRAPLCPAIPRWNKYDWLQHFRTILVSRVWRRSLHGAGLNEKQHFICLCVTCAVVCFNTCSISAPLYRRLFRLCTVLPTDTYTYRTQDKLLSGWLWYVPNALPTAWHQNVTTTRPNSSTQHATQIRLQHQWTATYNASAKHRGDMMAQTVGDRDKQRVVVDETTTSSYIKSVFCNAPDAMSYLPTLHLFDEVSVFLISPQSPSAEIEISVFWSSSKKNLLGSSRSASRSLQRVWLPSWRVKSRHCLLHLTIGQLQNYCGEQQMSFSFALIELTKSFDLVSRDGFFKVLRVIGCQHKLQNITESFHAGMNGIAVKWHLVGVIRHYSQQHQTRLQCSLDLSLLLCWKIPSTLQQRGSTCVPDQMTGSSTLIAWEIRQKNARIRDMLFADNGAVAIHTQQELQSLMNRFSQACEVFELTISLKKQTNIVGQDTEALPVITIDDYELDVVCQFTYLGSVINANLSLDTEIDKRIGKVASTVARLKTRLWANPELSMKTEDGSESTMPALPAHCCMKARHRLHIPGGIEYSTAPRTTWEKSVVLWADHGKTNI